MSKFLLIFQIIFITRVELKNHLLYSAHNYNNILLKNKKENSTRVE